MRPSSLGLVEMAYDKFISKNRKHIIGCDSDMCKFCVSAAVDTVNPGSTTSNYEYRSLFRNLQTHQLRRKSRSNKRMCSYLAKTYCFFTFFLFSAVWATRSKPIPNCNLPNSPHNTIPIGPTQCILKNKEQNIVFLFLKQETMVFPWFFRGFSMVFPWENPILPMSFFRRRDTKGAGVQGRHAAHVRRDQITQVVPGRPERYLPWRENCNNHWNNEFSH